MKKYNTHCFFFMYAFVLEGKFLKKKYRPTKIAENVF